MCSNYTEIHMIDANGIVIEALLDVRSMGMLGTIVTGLAA